MNYVVCNECLLMKKKMVRSYFEMISFPSLFLLSCWRERVCVCCSSSFSLKESVSVEEKEGGQISGPVPLEMSERERKRVYGTLLPASLEMK